MSRRKDKSQTILRLKKKYNPRLAFPQFFVVYVHLQNKTAKVNINEWSVTDFLKWTSKSLEQILEIPQK